MDRRLNEMVNARRSTSRLLWASSSSIIKRERRGNYVGVAEAYQKVEDVKALFGLLAMEIVYHGALEETVI